MKNADASTRARAVSPLPSTVSFEFVHDLLHSLGRQCSEQAVDQCLAQAGIVMKFVQHPDARITRDQLVRLYKAAASVTGDEMMGLWSRPIRTGSLKYIMKAISDSPSINVALYRFSKFWNLLLDDYSLQLSQTQEAITVGLLPRLPTACVNRFGHALMLKLTHGVVSWLIGREIPVLRVRLAFSEPSFSNDYQALFPSSASFDCSHSEISFPACLGQYRPARTLPDVKDFLERAPRDWIFTSYFEHTLRLKIRERLHVDLQLSLNDVARGLAMSPRTLLRRLKQEKLTFQNIKNELRYDLTILALTQSDISLTEIAYDLGFSSPAVFHRAFRHWTGTTPGNYRRLQRLSQEMRAAPFQSA